jgi:asparagine synthetase B (glutamine-hydrolysing)
VHNGVVYDEQGAAGTLKTNCDSEILLNLWEYDGIDDIEKYVTGYYAFAVLTDDGLLHIARDDKAMLYITWCATVDSYMIATTKEILQDIAKKMKWDIAEPEEITENVYAVFDGNNIIDQREIYPPKAARWDSKAARALGVDVDYYDNENWGPK